MGYEAFIARRHLRSQSRLGFIPIISIISILGVFVGVMALLVVLAVMNGFEQEVKARIIGTNAHVILLRYGNEPFAPDEGLLERVRTTEGVVALSPFVYTKAMLQTGDEQDGIVLKGIDPAGEPGVSDLLRRTIPEGESLAWDGSGSPPALLGSELALSLGVLTGETIVLASFQNAARTPFGTVPKMTRFRVAGTFDSGMYEYNSTLVLVPLRAAQGFLGMGENVTGVSIRVDDAYRAPEIADRVAARVGHPPYRTNNWIDLNRTLFSWMSTEKRVMFVILALVILVAAFNIASTLIMVVMEKTREIGVLKSMGASLRGVLAIFVIEGTTIGAIGTALGLAGGYALCWLLDRYNFIPLPGDIYFIDSLPVRMEAIDFARVAAASMAICLVATLYPAWKASRLDPVQAIRYE
ncbi:MAG: ABC transporter permease [Candidatus Latescibacterota bacterium]|nr:MAG: ABC transporter permease [Candidatus Latescibacterota bacterium]